MKGKPMKPNPRTRKTYRAPKPVEEIKRHARCSFCGGKSAGIEVDLVESKAGIRYRVPKDHAACKKSILSLSLFYLF